MQQLWYADNRDLVKWSVLLHVAERHRATHILQIAYFRPCTFGTLRVNGTEMPLHPAVINHFRDVGTIVQIKSGASIAIFDNVLDDRATYVNAALKFISDFPQGKRVVFLDPDTGLQPSTPSFKHVLEDEARAFWMALAPKDILMLYQHQTNKNGSAWIKPKLQQFSAAIGVPKTRVKVAYAEKVARDVAFFYAQKVLKTASPRRRAKRARLLSRSLGAKLQ